MRWNRIPLIGRQTEEQLRYNTAGLVKGGHVLVTVVFPMCLAGRHLVWRASRDFCLLLCSWCNSFVRCVRQGVLCCDLSDVRSEYCEVLV